MAPQYAFQAVRSEGTGTSVSRRIRELRDASVQDLIAAVRAVRDGKPPLSLRVITSLFAYVASLRDDPEAPAPEALTPREREILALLAEGLSNKEIAERLVLQPQTVKNYGHAVMQKLGLHSRLELIKSYRSRRRSWRALPIPDTAFRVADRASFA